jgi:hypothetical protein
MDFTYITVLDFGDGAVCQYNLEEVGDNYIFQDKDEPQAEEVEKFLIDQGHRLKDCEWMIHADPTINQIKL